MLKHKKPVDLTPSSFLLNCLNIIKLNSDAIILDMPCGYGRNSILMSSIVNQVVSADYDQDIIDDLWNKKYKNIKLIKLDANNELPFENKKFELVSIIHYVNLNFFNNVIRCIKPEGYLIIETYAGNGGNWISLPTKKEIEDILFNEFKIIKFKYNIVGPDKNKVSFRLLAKKLSIMGSPQKK